jgi:hypothetical protein
MGISFRSSTIKKSIIKLFDAKNICELKQNSTQLICFDISSHSEQFRFFGGTCRRVTSGRLRLASPFSAVSGESAQPDRKNNNKT